EGDLVVADHGTGAKGMGLQGESTVVIRDGRGVLAQVPLVNVGDEGDDGPRHGKVVEDHLSAYRHQFWRRRTAARERERANSQQTGKALDAHACHRSMSSAMSVNVGLTLRVRSSLTLHVRSSITRSVMSTQCFGRLKRTHCLKAAQRPESNCCRA